MELPRSRIFVTVATAGSYGRASAELNVTQSALSKSVKRLESYLPSPPFERTTRGVRLTPSGEALLPYCQEILNERRRAKRLEHAHQVGPRRQGARHVRHLFQTQARTHPPRTRRGQPAGLNRRQGTGESGVAHNKKSPRWVSPAWAQNSQLSEDYPIVGLERRRVKPNRPSASRPSAPGAGTPTSRSNTFGPAVWPTLAAMVPSLGPPVFTPRPE